MKETTAADEIATIESKIDDEILRSRISKIIDKPNSDSPWKSISTNPLISLTVGFLLTGLVGAFLANYYNTRQKQLEFELSDKQREREREKDQREKDLEFQRNKAERERDHEHDDRQKDLEYQRSLFQRQLEREKDERQKKLDFQRSLFQKEIERERSFSDELSKTRVPKFAEVWESVYFYETATENARKIFNETISPTVSPRDSSIALKQFQEGVARFIEATNLIQTRRKELDENMVKNRFWVDDESYTQIKSYVELTDQYLRVVEGLSRIRTNDPLQPDDQRKLKTLEAQAKSLDDRREKLREHITKLRDKLLHG